MMIRNSETSWRTVHKADMTNDGGDKAVMYVEP
jgi:hypothetical protein